MSTRKKIVVSVVTASVMVAVSFSSIVMAQSPQKTMRTTEITENVEKVVDGQTFFISPNAVGKITDKELEAISNQAPGSGNIIIQNVTEPAATPASALWQTISPSAWYDIYTIWSITKKMTQGDTPLAAQQITSVGQSQERNISISYKLSANASASVSIPSSLLTEVKAGLASEITKSINTKYYGPKVGSAILSYVFWLTPFVNRGSWTATGVGNLSGEKYGPYSGTWEEPSKFVEWTQEIR